MHNEWVQISQTPSTPTPFTNLKDCEVEIQNLFGSINTYRYDAVGSSSPSIAYNQTSNVSPNPLPIELLNYFNHHMLSNAVIRKNSKGVIDF